MRQPSDISCPEKKDLEICGIDPYRPRKGRSKRSKQLTVCLWTEARQKRLYTELIFWGSAILNGVTATVFGDEPKRIHRNSYHPAKMFS